MTKEGDCEEVDLTKHQLSEEELFCLQGCRTYRQYHGMRSGFEKHLCAFCNLDPTLNDIFWQDKHFMAWHVHPQFMRDELDIHVMIVPTRHVRFIADLNDKEAMSLVRANRALRKLYPTYVGGLNHVREGDMRLNAGTVPHLHFNVFMPKGTKEVRVAVFKDPADRAENTARAARFSQLYESGMTAEKFEHLVKEEEYNKGGYKTQRPGHTSC